MCIRLLRYSIMIFCPIAHHYCMTLAFIMCRTLEKCLKGGYACGLSHSVFHFSINSPVVFVFLSRENKRHLNNSRNNGWYVVRYGYLKNANFLLTLSSFYYRFRNGGFCSEKLWFTSYVGDQVFSSPELKAQMSFSDHLSSVVCLSVRL